VGVELQPAINKPVKTTGSNDILFMNFIVGLFICLLQIEQEITVEREKKLPFTLVTPGMGLLEVFVSVVSSPQGARRI
jgi:hypothetical protein